MSYSSWSRRETQGGYEQRAQEPQTNCVKMTLRSSRREEAKPKPSHTEPTMPTPPPPPPKPAKGRPVAVTKDEREREVGSKACHSLFALTLLLSQSTIHIPHLLNPRTKPLSTTYNRIKIVRSEPQTPSLPKRLSHSHLTRLRRSLS